MGVVSTCLVQLPSREATMLFARSLVSQSAQLFLAAALLLLTCLTGQGSGNRTVDVLLEISELSSPVCLGPSVEVHYIEIPAVAGEDWVFLDEVQVGRGFLPEIILPSSSSAEGLQFRLRQLQHDGAGRQCWRVVEFTVRTRVNNGTMTQLVCITNNDINGFKCSSSGQNNTGADFCSEGVREIIIHAVYFNQTENSEDCP